MLQDTRVTESNADDEVVNVNQTDVEKPSALIRKAVENYDKLNGNKFRLTSDFYFHLTKESNNKGLCKVCLAGSLLSFLADKKEQLPYTNYGGNYTVFDIHSYIDDYYRNNRLTDNLEEIGVTQDIIKDIIVLECVRKGELSEAVTYHDLFPKANVNGGKPFDWHDEQLNIRMDCQNRYHDHPELAEIADDKNSYIDWQSKKEWTENARKEFLHRADLLESIGY